jgi:ABC-2 type transport system permease protein/capsular polysaccharide transport system permease protein
MTMISKTSPPPPAACSLLESFAIQRRVIWALMMREIITSFGRKGFGFAWMFLEPMLFTLVITGLWSMVGGHKFSGIPIAAFALTGYSCVLLWRNMPGRAESAVQMNRPLLYHRNVRIMDVFLARLILMAGGATMSFIILGFIFCWIGLIASPEDPMLVLQGWLMIGLFGMSLAIFIGTLNAKWHWVEKFWHPLSYVLMPLSGAVFLIDHLPKKAQGFLLWIPMIHGCECIRDGYFGSKFTAHYSPAYIMIWSVCLLYVAMLALRKISKSTEH